MLNWWPNKLLIVSHKLRETPWVIEPDVIIIEEKGCKVQNTSKIDSDNNQIIRMVKNIVEIVSLLMVLRIKSFPSSNSLWEFF